MNLDDHKEMHKLVRAMDRKMKALISSMKSGEKIKVSQINKLLRLKNRDFARIKSLLDDDFCRNVSKGVSNYFSDEKPSPAWWANVKRLWGHRR